MKKNVLCIFLALLLLAVMLPGCAPEETPVEKLCRVESVEEDGIIVYMKDMGYVYLKNVPGDLELGRYSNLYVTFLESDLKPETGTFSPDSNRELTYSYVLENIRNVRRPNAGEPTFG